MTRSHASRAVGVRVLCTHGGHGETCPVVMARTAHAAVHKTRGLVGRGLVHGASLARRVVKTRTPEGLSTRPRLVGRGLVHTERASRASEPHPALSAASHGGRIPEGKRMFSRRNLAQTVTGAPHKTGARGSVYELHPCILSLRSLRRVTWGGFGGKAPGFASKPVPALAGLSA